MQQWNSSALNFDHTLAKTLLIQVFVPIPLSISALLASIAAIRVRLSAFLNDAPGYLQAHGPKYHNCLRPGASIASCVANTTL
jgi:hypothetical protein